MSTGKSTARTNRIAVSGPTVPWIPDRYPSSRRSDHVDVYKSAKNGEVTVPDPYVWLEENTTETEEWVSVQESFTREYLDQIPDRKRLERAIREGSDFPEFFAPILEGDHWYWYYNSGLQSQNVLYRSPSKILPQFSINSSRDQDQDEGPGGDIFFDVNLLSEDGTTTIATSSFSPDGQYFAYGVSRSGSDFCIVYIRHKDSVLGQVDNQGASGNRLRHDEGRLSGIVTNEDLNAALYYHRVGTPQAEDLLIMKDDIHTEYMWAVVVSEEENGRWVSLYIQRDSASKNLLRVADLTRTKIGPDMEWVKVVNEFEAAYHPLAHDGSKVLMITNKDAPRYKLVTIDISAGTPEFVDLIHEDPEALLVSVDATPNGKLFVVYQRNVQDELYIYSRMGKREARLVPDFVGSITVSSQLRQTEVFVTLTGFTTPRIVMVYNLALPEAKRALVHWRATVTKGLNPLEFSTEQVWYSSKDETRIPMFIVKHVDTKLNGTAPAIQYGYGGFDHCVTPSFMPDILTFLKHYGGVYAAVNIRGGGEFGDEWHQGGIKEKKHNCFDDFIAATKYLEDNQFAGKGKVAINGSSNGGLLVAACVNRAPEGTFGAAVGDVGVYDYLKFPLFTSGRAWISDYGDPEDPVDFDFMYPIAPLLNVPKARTLPPMLILTADHDDRVVPLHSFKLAAVLQHARPHNEHPLLLRVQKKAGHGGQSTEQTIRQQADTWAFVANAFGLEWKNL